MKEFMLSLLEDYSKQNEININSAGTISKDILSRIKQNIHVFTRKLLYSKNKSNRFQFLSPTNKEDSNKKETKIF